MALRQFIILLNVMLQVCYNFLYIYYIHIIENLKLSRSADSKVLLAKKKNFLNIFARHQ